MRYQAKSILVGRKKSAETNCDVRPCFISLFDENNPHLSVEGPKEVLEFDKVHKVIIKDLDVNYLLPGNDLVINDLKEIEVNRNGPHVVISGRHA